MTQGDLFRDEAIDRVEENADREWRKLALATIEDSAWIFRTITTDDIWTILDRSIYSTHDNRAMGAVMRKAQTNGWIEPTDRVVKSTRAVCHSRPIRVWRSRLI